MANNYFTVSGAPSTGSQGASALIRSEFAAIEEGFDRLPDLAGSANLPIFVNAASNALAALAIDQAREKLGLGVGTDVQAYSPTLSSVAALATAADKMLYTTGPNAFAETSLTAAARSLLDDANTSAMLSTLGVSDFMKNLLDDASAAAARGTLGAAAATDPIGAAQTWQNVLASRSLNTNFLNSTGRPIVVNVALRMGNLYEEGEVVAYINGVQVARQTGSIAQYHSFSFIVTPGHAYQIAAVGGIPALPVVWAELR